MAVQLQTRCKLAQSIGKMVVQVKMKPLSMSAPKEKYSISPALIYIIMKRMVVCNRQNNYTV